MDDVAPPESKTPRAGCRRWARRPCTNLRSREAWNEALTATNAPGSPLSRFHFYLEFSASGWTLRPMLLSVTQADGAAGRDLEPRGQ